MCDIEDAKKSLKTEIFGIVFNIALAILIVFINDIDKNHTAIYSLSLILISVANGILLNSIIDNIKTIKNI